MLFCKEGEVVEEGKRVSICSVGVKRTISISWETEAEEGGEDQDMMGEGMSAPVGVLMAKEKEGGESVLWEVEGVLTSTEEIGGEEALRGSVGKIGGDIYERMGKRGEEVAVTATATFPDKATEATQGLEFYSVGRSDISSGISAGVTVEGAEEGRGGVVIRKEKVEAEEGSIDEGRSSVASVEVDDEGFVSSLGVFACFVRSHSLAAYSICAYILAARGRGVFEEEKGKRVHWKKVAMGSYKDALRNLKGF